MREGWKKRTIDSLCAQITSGGTPSRRNPEFFVASGMGTKPWLKTKELNDRLIWDTEEHITEAAIKASSAKLLPTNTVVMAMYGATVGQLGILGTAMTCNQAVCAMVVNPSEADHRFLFYRLLHDRNALVNLAVGSAQQNLSGAVIKRFAFPCPPLAEQQHIAGVLGALDDLIEKNMALQKALQELRRTVFRSACLKTNRSVSFGDLASLSTERAAPSEIVGDSIYLGLEHFGENGTGLISAGTAQGLDSQKSRFRVGDILYGKLRPYFRKVARPDFNGICSTEIWIIRPAPGVDPELLEWVVSSEEFTEFAMRGSSGTHMPRAIWDHVSRMPVNLPNPEVLTSAAAVTRPLWHQSWALRTENQALLRTRDELLPLLLSGAVTVSEVAA